MQEVKILARGVIFSDTSLADEVVYNIEASFTRC